MKRFVNALVGFVKGDLLRTAALALALVGVFALSGGSEGAASAQETLQATAEAEAAPETTALQAEVARYKSVIAGFQSEVASLRESLEEKTAQLEALAAADEAEAASSEKASSEAPSSKASSTSSSSKASSSSAAKSPSSSSAAKASSSSSAPSKSSSAPVAEPPAEEEPYVEERASYEPPKASSSSNSYTVYITDTGTKYHSSGCSYLAKSKHSISVDSAVSQGYDACSRCNP
jgi:hypothetical protein